MVQKKIQKNLFTEPKIIRENKEVLIERGNINLPLTNFYNSIPNKYLNYKWRLFITKSI